MINKERRKKKQVQYRKTYRNKCTQDITKYLKYIYCHAVRNSKILNVSYIDKESFVKHFANDSLFKILYDKWSKILFDKDKPSIVRIDKKYGYELWNLCVMTLGQSYLYSRRLQDINTSKKGILLNNIETNQSILFKSQRSCAMYLGVSSRNLREHIIKNKPIKGYIVQYETSIQNNE